VVLEIILVGAFPGVLPTLVNAISLLEKELKKITRKNYGEHPLYSLLPPPIWQRLRTFY
jgi:hypothetical protein